MSCGGSSKVSFFVALEIPFRQTSSPMTRNVRLALTALLLVPPATLRAADAIPTATPAPNALRGKGLAEHDFFYAGEAKEENLYIIK